MRKSTALMSILLGAGAILPGTFVQAAEPGQASAPQAACRTSMGIAAGAQKCLAPKTTQAAPARLTQVARATLDRNVCNRQATKIERDTCLNRVESTA